MASQLTAVLVWLIGSVLGLRDIQLSVPEAVGVGSSATLGCRWALDTGEALYTVKWYHGAQEFFRFVPKEMPNTRVFSQTGISVDISRSGAQQVVLRDATKGLSGRYRCEVSADAPFFHTTYKSATMRVIELPDSQPIVRAQKSWYSVGDMLRANCTSSPADPPANLTWLLNGYEVKGLDIPVPEVSYNRKQSFISDASLEDANRIIFTPWETPPGYEEVQPEDVTPRDTFEENIESTTHFSRYDLSKNISNEEERSNKTSSFSQLIMRVQPTHFQKRNYCTDGRIYAVENKGELKGWVAPCTSSAISCRSIHKLTSSNHVV
ncbi:unnamed protein product [Leptidea sinapis]|uniref:Ig-like domain-containing protein n=1 Tax=Leptidea sinapis TaxID=189913 RepID=A0A5E4QYF5_9NEOP|nr:unnamed protein product [Leptidea sinapis]